MKGGGFLNKMLLISLIFMQGNAESYKITDQIYMDISISGKPAGRIIFGLFGEVAPKTVENFKILALYGINGKSYVGTDFLIALKKVMILGGDLVNNNGTGSVSIYGEYFDDENFDVKPDSPGLLMMVNFGGPNSNGCMFLITTMATPWLHEKNVVFGKVLKGQGLVHKIEHLRTDFNDKLLAKVTITKCGYIETTPFFEDHKNYELTLWAWIKAGWFPLSFSFGILLFFQFIMSKLDILEKKIN